MIKMLIVDDEEETRIGLADSIAWCKLGLEVVGMAEDGIEGYNLAKDLKPSIILLDVRMPRKWKLL